MPDYYEKDPQDFLDYGIKAADALHAESDEIDQDEDGNFLVTWTVPDGLVKENESIRDGETEKVDPGTIVPNSVGIVWLSGGTVGETYQVSGRIETTGGRTYERSFTVYVVER